ncbi:MAG: ISKra4 family transposase [Actinobacteria bacterium]|nr:ISKra4 family transposase [Actinomycetota bacterium]
MEAYALETSRAVFGESRDRFEEMVSWLDSHEATGLTHAELEVQLQLRGRELLRQLTQDYLDRRADRERRLAEVVGADAVRRSSAETGRVRGLSTVFGPVTVRRMTYREPGYASLHPADGVLNLPAEKHSHGLRLLAAREGARGSFADASDAIARVSGQQLGNRQVEELTQRAAVDFDRFYAQRRRHLSLAGDVLVLSYDAKGVVMRPQALRAATAQAAARATPKLATRLSRGEKGHRKRMAEVGSVYDATPVSRTAQDILAGGGGPPAPKKGPRAHGKWLTASITADAAEVIGQVFDEAERRDPDHHRRWVVLVDGNAHQIDRSKAQAQARHVEVTIVIDFIHVIEYVWKAAWSLFAEADPAAEHWVRTQGLRILQGHSDQVAATVRRSTAGLPAGQRAGAQACVRYLTNTGPYLDYPTALHQGWPIATGVIEGACRHLIKDRLDLTGARWGLPGAEAVLKLRALLSNGDFNDYWDYHLTQEKHRVHEMCYQNGVIPPA